MYAPCMVYVIYRKVLEAFKVYLTPQAISIQARDLVRKGRCDSDLPSADDTLLIATPKRSLPIAVFLLQYEKENSSRTCKVALEDRKLPISTSSKAGIVWKETQFLPWFILQEQSLCPLFLSTLGLWIVPPPKDDTSYHHHVIIQVHPI